MQDNRFYFTSYHLSPTFKIFFLIYYLLLQRRFIQDKIIRNLIPVCHERVSHLSPTLGELCMKYNIHGLKFWKLQQLRLFLSLGCLKIFGKMLKLSWQLHALSIVQQIKLSELQLIFEMTVLKNEKYYLLLFLWN